MSGEDVQENAMKASRHVSNEGDADPNVLWFAEQCQTNNVRIDALIHSAELARDPEMAAFFRRAKGALQRLSGVQGLSQAA
jgi:hypothetical protein